MNLKSHMAKLSLEARGVLATRCGTTRGHLQNVAYGHRPCAPEVAAAIERETSGAVTCEEIREDLNWVRVKDKSWPHKSGRPLLDMTTTPTEA